MSTPPKFRFAIRNAFAGYYFVNGAGQVGVDSNPRYVKSPIGWNDTEIKWMRHPVYMGIGRTLTTSYQFHGDAAKIIRYLYLTQGIEAYALIDIEIRAYSGTSWAYIPYYSGPIDFGKFDGAMKIPQVNILESGLNALLKANERIAQEIPVLDDDCLNVLMSGVQLLNSATFIMSNNPLGDNTNVANIPKLTLVATETGDAQDVQDVDYSDVGSLNFIGKQFFTASAVTTISLYYNYKIKGSALPGFNYATGALRSSFFVKDVFGNTTQTFDIVNENNYLTFLGVFFPAVGTLSIAMNAGDQLYFRTGMFNIQTEWEYGTVINSEPNIKISYSSLYSDTTIRAYRYHQLWSKAVASAIGNGIVGTSPYLLNPGLSRNQNWDSRPFNTLVSPGDAIRGLGDGTISGGAKIKTTIADIFQDASTQWDMALTELPATNELRLVPMAEVFQNVEIANLGEVAGLSTPPFTEFFKGKVDVGYQKRDYDQLNGRFEYNQGQIFDYGFTKPFEPEDRLSPFRADCIGIEFTRINLSNKTTTDAGSDNDNFLIDVNDAPTLGKWTIYKPNSAVNTSGVPYPGSVYNVALTPHRKQLRNLRRDAILFHLRTSDEIFKTGDKNVDLVSNIGAGTVSEKADIPNSLLNNPYFLPIFLKFTCKPDANMILLMDTMPHGYFSLYWKGKLLKGFPWEVGTKPAFPAQYEFTLLCHPDVNLADLQD